MDFIAQQTWWILLKKEKGCQHMILIYILKIIRDEKKKMTTIKRSEYQYLRYSFKSENLCLLCPA